MRLRKLHSMKTNSTHEEIHIVVLNTLMKAIGIENQLTPTDSPLRKVFLASATQDNLTVQVKVANCS